MRVLYFAYIKYADGPNSHAQGFIGEIQKLVEGFSVIGLTSKVKPYYYKGAKYKKILKTFQPKIWYDFKKILLNINDFISEYSQIKNFKPDIIIFRYELYRLTPLIFSYLFKIPLVLESNGSAAYECDKFGTKGNKRVACFVEGRILKHAKVVYTVSNVLKKYYLQSYNNMDGKKIVTIPNGADLKRMKPLDKIESKKKIGLDQAFIVGFIGSFAPWHDINTLINSAIRIKKAEVKIVYLLIGAGRLKLNYQKRVIDEGLEEIVIFHDPVDYIDIPLFLSAIDMASVLSLPTYGNDFHGSPIKLFEYMAMEKAVIATKLGQFTEIIEDGRNGYLVDLEDDCRVTEIILECQRHQERLNQIGVNARNTIVEKKLTWQNNAEKVHGLCQEILLNN